jgi:glycine oxidase
MNFDVCVVGNGSIGASVAVALSLQDPNMTIGLIGKADRPYGASPAAGAMHGCFGEITTGLLNSKYGRHKLEMDIAANKLWPGWLDMLNEKQTTNAKVRTKFGTFVIVNTISGTMEDRNYEAIKQQLIEYKAPFEDVDPNSIEGLYASSEARPVRGLYMPQEGSIDSSSLLGALDNYVNQAENISAVNGEVVSFIMEGNTIKGVVLDNASQISSKYVVLAAGIQSHNLLEKIPSLKYRIPKVFPGEGCSLLLEQPQHTSRLEHVIRTPNRSFACGLHVVPRDNNLLYVGATNNVSIDPAKNPMIMDMTFLLDCAVDQINQNYYAARAIKWSTGNRPVPIDTMPLIGGTSVPGLFVLTGTYRDGLHQSPLLAQHIACLITGKPGLFENPFLPEREPLALFTKEQAIQETLMHYDAVGLEHRMKTPKIGWHQTFSRHFEDAIRNVYDGLDDVPYILPPEFVSIIDNDRKNMLPLFRDYYQNVQQTWQGAAKQGKTKRVADLAAV